LKQKKPEKEHDDSKPHLEPEEKTTPPEPEKMDISSENLDNSKESNKSVRFESEKENPEKQEKPSVSPATDSKPRPEFKPMKKKSDDDDEMEASVFQSSSKLKPKRKISLLSKWAIQNLTIIIILQRTDLLMSLIIS